MTQRFENGGITLYISERQWDRELKIETIGVDASHADVYRYPYEPTPYTVLSRLVESGYVRPDSHWIDYGCGKGRVSFFLHHQTGCRVTGVEFNESIFQVAEGNHCTYGNMEGLEFVCANAEHYPVGDADCFYFFNPFCVQILRSVLGQIRMSYYENPRKLRLFFYYPSEEYLTELMASEFNFVEKLDCMDLFAVRDQREHILIFERN